LMLSANEGASAVAMSGQVLSCARDQIMIILGAFVKRTGTEKKSENSQSTHPAHPAGNKPLFDLGEA
jgi:hypothetical protein